MNMEDIIATKTQLNNELRVALSTMEKKDTIYNIKQRIAENQKRCPHYDPNYNFVWVDDTCPYCGKKHCYKAEANENADN